MSDIDSIFPDRTLGFGYRKDATFRRDGADWLIDYENQGELVYRIRVGERTQIQEFDDGKEAGLTEHRDLASAFLHHGLAVYGFGRRQGLPVWERRLLSRLPEGSYGQVFSPGWQGEPLEVYYPDGILRRILIPAWSEPKGLVQRLIQLGIPEASILEIPDATLTTTGDDGRQETEPAYLVHGLAFAREVAPILRSLADGGLTAPGVRQRPILLYAHSIRWPATLGFDGDPGDPIRRYVFGLPSGLKETFLARLEKAAEKKAGQEGGAR